MEAVAVDHDSDSRLKRILGRTRVIAMIGVSANPVRPSHYVARYLGLKGFTVIPVNPGHAGEQILGRTVYARIADIPEPARVDMIEIFRRPEAVPGILTEAFAHLPGLRTVWMQIGVTHPEAAARAEARGLEVVQDRCAKIEYQRHFGELRIGGIATGIVSSRL